MHRSLSEVGWLRWFWPFILPPPTNSTQNSKNEPCFYRIAHILLDLIGTDTAHKTFAIYILDIRMTQKALAALKRLISTEKQAALKLTTFTIAITQIASYKWFWDKLLLIMPYILCTHYKVTILPSLRPAPTTVPLWYVLNKLL